MKRVVCLLLCLLMACSLLACGKTDRPEEPATTEPPSTEPVTEPTAAPVSAAPAEPAVFSLKTLPEIGAFVSDEKKAYFFDDGPHKTFEARDDYGEIVPYYAEAEKYYPTDWSYEDPDTGEVYSGSTPEDEAGYFERFGFCTADGRIITTGLFENMFRYESASGEVLYVAYPERVYEMCGEVYLIAGDGSVVLHLTEDDAELHALDKTENGSGKGLLTVRYFKSERLQLMDFSGKVLYEYLPSRSGKENAPYIEYADEAGMLLRCFSKDGEYYVRQNYDGKQTAAFPEEYGVLRGVYGNQVLLMGSWGDWSRLVSMDGKALTDGYAELQWSDHFNCFFAETDGEMQRYDADGKKTGALVEDFSMLEQGYGLNYLYDPETQSLMDASFRPVPLAIDSGSVVLVEELYGGWDRSGYSTLLVRTDTDDLYVFSNSGERLAKLQNVLYETWDTDEDGVNDEVREGVEERSYEISERDGLICAQTKTGIELLDTRSGLATTLPKHAAAYFSETDPLNSRVFSLQYTKDDGTYQWYHDLFRRDSGECFLSGAVCAQSFGDRIAAATPTHSYLLDETGKVLLCLKNDKLV